MTSTLVSHSLPDHTQLPDRDGEFVRNFQEHPQSIILTTSILPILEKLHPDGNFCIGQDSGIYWRITDPPEGGAVAPDWFYVPHVPPLLNGVFRRSYVLWQEIVAPLIAIEFVSGSGAEERDATPYQGKFWIYEQAIRIPFYAIFDAWQDLKGIYCPQPKNEAIALQERLARETAERLLAQERQEKQKLLAYLQSMGIDLDTIP